MPALTVITIDIGANDAFLCQQSTADGCVSEIGGVLNTVATHSAGAASDASPVAQKKRSVIQVDEAEDARLTGGARGRVTADQYWRDVGTIDAYYDANMDLLRPVPAMDLYQDDWSIRTYEGQHPPARSVPGRSGREADIVNCMLAGGTVVIGASVRHSILFPNVRLDEGAVVEHALLFQGVTVGEGAQLRRCIVDKHVAIPPGARIGFDAAEDARRFTVSDNGVVAIGKGHRFDAGS